MTGSPLDLAKDYLRQQGRICTEDAAERIYQRLCAESVKRFSPLLCDAIACMGYLRDENRRLLTINENRIDIHQKRLRAEIAGIIAEMFERAIATKPPPDEDEELWAQVK